MRKIFRKFFYHPSPHLPLLHKRTCAYQGVGIVSFLEIFLYALNEWSLAVKLICEYKTRELPQLIKENWWLYFFIIVPEAKQNYIATSRYEFIQDIFYLS